MNLPIKEEGKFKYFEQGDGPVLLLLHGLFGALSNFEATIKYFSQSHKVVVPLLPIYELPIRKANITNLVVHLAEFIQHKNYQSVTLLGNSLGGHIALLYVFDYPTRVKSMVLTGSSGLYENTLSGVYPKRRNYDYIKAQTEGVFFDPKIASKQLVDEIYDTVNKREKAIRVISVAKSAIKNNVSEHLHKIKVPSLLVWGIQDQITPLFVAKEFEKGIPNAQLQLLDETGHAPMMEKPEAFNNLVRNFLMNLSEQSSTTSM